jgi:dolichol kinase
VNAALFLPLVKLACSIALLMGAIAAIRWIGQRHGWGPEVSRKSVHVAIGLYAMLLPVIFQQVWPVVALLIVALGIMVWLRLPGVRTGGLGATIHSVQRSSWGDIWLALAIGFVFLRSEGEYILFGLPMAIITLSDSAAALTGSAYGRARFQVEAGLKSWEGVVAFFMVSVIVALVMLLLLTDAPRVNIVVLAFAIAGFGAIVEAVSWRGLDNLFVPIGIHFFLLGFLFASPWELGAIAAQFLVALVIVALLAHRIGLSRHASRAFMVAIFLFLGVGGVYGAIAPALAIGAHMVARRRPAAGYHRDLDFIATLGAVGLIWFFIGETIGPNALNFYNLGMAGLVLGLLLVGLEQRWWLALAALSAMIFAYFALLEFAPSYTVSGAFLPWIAWASLLLVIGAVKLRLNWFDRWRTSRLAATANIVPLSGYLVYVGMG